MFKFINNIKNKNILKFIELLNNAENTEAYNYFLKYPEVNSFPLTLHFAAYYKNKSVLEKLVKARPINLLDSCNYNALHYALYPEPLFVGMDNFKKNEILYKESLFGNRSLAFFTYKEKRVFNIDFEDIIEIVEILTKAGINVNQKAKLRYSEEIERPIDFAVEDDIELFRDILKCLINYGLKLDYWECVGWSASESFKSLLLDLYTYEKDEDKLFEVFTLLHKNGAILELKKDEYILPIFPDGCEPNPLNFNYQLLRKYNDAKTGNKKIFKYILEHSSVTKENEVFFKT